MVLLKKHKKHLKVKLCLQKNIDNSIKKGSVKMSKNFRESLKEQMENEEFKQEWDKTELEYQIIKAIITAREEKNITQKELAEMTGITQNDISKLENGSANPSLQTLKKLANGLGMAIKLEFVPITNK